MKNHAGGMWSECEEEKPTSSPAGDVAAGQGGLLRGEPSYGMDRRRKIPDKRRERHENLEMGKGTAPQ